MDIGKTIRAEHPSDDPKVGVCASEKIKYDALGKVLAALSEEHLAQAGCTCLNLVKCIYGALSQTPSNN
jgi:hypothetical protein